MKKFSIKLLKRIDDILYELSSYPSRTQPEGAFSYTYNITLSLKKRANFTDDFKIQS